jgi:voltage-gated sodium channel
MATVAPAAPSPSSLLSAAPGIRRRELVDHIATTVMTLCAALAVITLLLILLYVSGVMATQLFGDVDPEHFGSLGQALLSLFQVTTGDDWANVVRPTTDAEPWAWAFFLVFVVLSTYIVLNLFIAVAVEALDRQVEEDNSELVDEVETHMDESTAAILASLADLKQQVASLEARLEGRD